ncbi:MAG: type II secretion system F family protein [Candidatus Moranbacteria bacterium]|nr:type II secretion system F family protein [Candidatus Moranbacteria bacterium]
MKFKFKATNQEGQKKKGVIEAANRETANNLLKRNGLNPISVVAVRKSSGFIEKLENMTTTVKQKDILVFFRELSTLIGAKIPIATSLQTIQDQTDNKKLASIIGEIEADVRDGLSVSDGFAKHPDVFPPLTVNMIKAGELSGNLQGAIDYVNKNTERNYQLTSQVKGALMYPGFVILVAGVIGFLTITWILPRLTEVIRDLNVDVPWYTEAMISLGAFMESYWWAVLFAIFAFVGGMYAYIKSEGGKKEWDSFQLKLPILGKLFTYVYITRFAENFSVLIKGGIPIVKSLTIVGDVVNNEVYRKIIRLAAKDIEDGGEIGREFFKHEEIPLMVARMMKIGQETGRLGQILEDIADFYQKEVTQITKNISSIIEPIIIVALGLGVGALVFSVLLPIYNIAGQL